MLLANAQTIYNGETISPLTVEFENNGPWITLRAPGFIVVRHSDTFKREVTMMFYEWLQVIPKIKHYNPYDLPF